MNASDVDAPGDGLFDDDFDDDDDDAGVDFPEFDPSAELEAQKAVPAIDALQSQASPQPNEITSIPEPVIKFEASPQPADAPQDELDADNPFGVDPFAASGSQSDHLEDDDDDEIDADNPFAMFDEPDDPEQGNDLKEHIDGGADDDVDPFS